MAINFVPLPGQILMCDFTTGFMRSEMQKIRHCIVVSPNNYGGTCLIVPLSTLAPRPEGPCHYRVPRNVYPCIECGTEVWAKADMLTHAGFPRLDRPLEAGVYVRRLLNKNDLDAILRTVFNAINCAHIAQHL